MSKCLKIRYQIAAKLALASTAKIDGPRRPKSEKRAYPCPQCKGWHLTSAAR